MNFVFITRSGLSNLLTARDAMRVANYATLPTAARLPLLGRKCRPAFAGSDAVDSTRLSPLLREPVKLEPIGYMDRMVREKLL
jgi:hypothetical protein